MESYEYEVKKVIEALTEKGIATRLDCVSLDCRAFGRTIIDELKKRGIENALYTEGALDNYFDYSGVVFDPDYYNYNEVVEYLRLNVLE